jgi:hypothetical protein
VPAKRAARDRADGNRSHPGKGEGDSGGAGDLRQVTDAGRAGEGGGVDARGQGCAEFGGGVLRDGVLVCVDDIDNSAGGAKRVGDKIASDGGTRKKNTLARSKIGERLDQAFRNVFLRRQRDHEAGPPGSFGTGLAYSRNLRFRAGEDNPARGAAVGERLYGVGARENEPVVGIQIAERDVERIEAGWRLNFKHGNLDGFGSGGAQAFTEVAGLMGGAGNEDALVGEGWGGRCGHQDLVNCSRYGTTEVVQSNLFAVQLEVAVAHAEAPAEGSAAVSRSAAAPAFMSLLAMSWPRARGPISARRVS